MTEIKELATGQRSENRGTGNGQPRAIAKRRRATSRALSSCKVDSTGKMPPRPAPALDFHDPLRPEFRDETAGQPKRVSGIKRCAEPEIDFLDPGGGGPAHPAT